ncbi:hypothetical protein [Sphingomonas sanxanigenens]|uniref:hypothetical protein n=1 Tax=Sphingomonas sanxanigenens TaxID=397260 RepID=UPI0013015039|nr:hypothetical protein [Sphingomonas sanxanigenens]
MNEQVATRLKEQAAHALPHMLIQTLSQEIGRVPNQFEFISYFKLAFTCTPIRTLMEASTSKQLVGKDGLSDQEFDRLLSPYIGASLRASRQV